MPRRSSSYKLLRSLYRLLLRRLHAARRHARVTWLDARARRCHIELLQPRMMFSFATVAGETVVNSPTTGNHQTPSVAVDASGNSLVVWSGQYSGQHWLIYGQRFNSSGAAIGAEFVISQTTTQDDKQPQVAMNANGAFIVTWSRNVNGGDVLAREYTAQGVPQTNEFTVNSTLPGSQGDPVAGIDRSGNFVIAWDGQAPADNQGIYQQTYQSGGIASGSNVLVNTTTTGSQTLPALAMNDAGQYVVAWIDGSQQGGQIEAQRFASSGAAVAQTSSPGPGLATKNSIHPRESTAAAISPSAGPRSFPIRTSTTFSSADITRAAPSLTPLRQPRTSTPPTNRRFLQSRCERTGTSLSRG